MRGLGICFGRVEFLEREEVRKCVSNSYHIHRGLMFWNVKRSGYTEGRVVRAGCWRCISVPSFSFSGSGGAFCGLGVLFLVRACFLRSGRAFYRHGGGFCRRGGGFSDPGEFYPLRGRFSRARGEFLRLRGSFFRPGAFFRVGAKFWIPCGGGLLGGASPLPAKALVPHIRGFRFPAPPACSGCPYRDSGGSRNLTLSLA